MKKALYTINFGKYNPLREPLIVTEGWDYICFTDQDLKSDLFQIRKIETPLSGHLAARDYYINSQRHLPEYDLTVMIGGQLQVNCNLDELLLEYCDLGADFIMMNHCRNCTYLEALENKKFFGDGGKRMIEKQMNKYANEGFPEEFGLFAHGVIVRLKGENIAKHEALWWQEVSNPEYVTRDQLSFMYILWKHRLVKVNSFGDYWKIIHSLFKIYKHGNWKQI